MGYILNLILELFLRNFHFTSNFILILFNLSQKFCNFGCYLKKQVHLLQNSLSFLDIILIFFSFCSNSFFFYPQITSFFLFLWMYFSYFFLFAPILSFFILKPLLSSFSFGCISLIFFFLLQITPENTLQLFSLFFLYLKDVLLFQKS